MTKRDVARLALPAPVLAPLTAATFGAQASAAHRTVPAPVLAPLTAAAPFAQACAAAL